MSCYFLLQSSIHYNHIKRCNRRCVCLSSVTASSVDTPWLVLLIRCVAVNRLVVESHIKWIMTELQGRSINSRHTHSEGKLLSITTWQLTNVTLAKVYLWNMLFKSMGVLFLCSVISVGWFRWEHCNLWNSMPNPSR